ncbi:Fic family protein [Bacillus cereus]|uniref:Fic family protein n=1 Tax=Bacillus thuringiensis TaxID=1428 RepID=UPI000A3C831C|nr:Fic family protein [Bacillus thuringiensis]MCU5408497.1 Fic family protein [Bacillus cereus]OUB78099.1 cell filamentation protein Fic [Bacillus thuringiensis serovar zhaodongensis]
MRNFFDDKYKNIELKRRLINLISEISEFKGKLAAYQEQNPGIFNSLQKTIPLHYIKNFTTIYEDIKVPNKRLKELILDDIVPQNISEDAIFCYYQTLSFVHKNACNLLINPATIQELHFQLIHYITSDSAKWREKYIIIPGIPECGMHLNSYRILPHELIPQFMEQLCDQFNSLNTSKELHSLLLIARFILNFYCIVPFNQGNMKLAIILMQLLLIKSGHTFVKYICLDKYIKKHEYEYYNSIYKSSVNWYYEEHNSSFWLEKFLTIILEAYKDLHNTVLDSICKHTKVERIQDFILKQKHPFTKESIRNAYPDIAESTISKTLNTLQLFGHIKLITKGRNASWIKIQS